MSEDWRGDVAWAAEQCCKVAERLGRLLEQQDVPAWAFPVGTDEYPPERWYAATLHDTTGVRNGGYAHIGVDENLDVPGATWTGDNPCSASPLALSRSWAIRLATWAA